MPGIDFYSLDNYRLDGPAKLDSLLTKTGNLTIGNGQKNITGIGFKPMILIVTLNGSTGSNFGYINLRTICFRGGDTTSTSYVYGYDSSLTPYSSDITVSGVVFTDNEVSFDLTLRTSPAFSTSLTYQVFGV